MSRIQVLILASLGTLTVLVCIVAFSLIWLRFAPETEPPTPIPPTPSPAPTVTPIPMATRTPRPDVGDKYDARAICQNFVEDRLIAPRDAKWPGLFEEQPEAVQLDATTWRVVGWVDAANRMGAHIRTTYTCVVSYIGADRWRLESLDLHDPSSP